MAAGALPSVASLAMSCALLTALPVVVSAHGVLFAATLCLLLTQCTSHLPLQQWVSRCRKAF